MPRRRPDPIYVQIADPDGVRTIDWMFGLLLVGVAVFAAFVGVGASLGVFK